MGTEGSLGMYFGFIVQISLVLIFCDARPRIFCSLCLIEVTGTVNALPLLDTDLKRKANRILERVKELYNH